MLAAESVGLVEAALPGAESAGSIVVLLLLLPDVVKSGFWNR